MAAGSEKRRGVGFLTQLIILVLLVPIAIITIAYFLSPTSPFKPAPPAPPPVTVGQIQKLYRLETAQITGQTIVTGETNSALPFSKASISYQVVMTMTAGVDLSKMKDSDIQADGETLRIALPDPEILSENADFIPVSENKEIFAGPSEKKDLPKMVVDEGKRRVRQTVLEQGELIRQARTNAEDQLRNLVFQIGPQYHKVEFLTRTPPTSQTSPQPSAPPR